MYDTVTEENRRKNLTFGIASTTNKDITSDEFTWSFDKDLNLVVSFGKAPVSDLDKLAIQAACDVQFGAGKVVVS